jgi:hypothetical protein
VTLPGTLTLAVCRSDSYGNHRERSREVRSLGFLVDESTMLRENLEKDAENLEMLCGRVADAPKNPREREEVRSLRLLVDESITPQRSSEKEAEKLEVWVSWWTSCWCPSNNEQYFSRQILMVK